MLYKKCLKKNERFSYEFGVSSESSLHRSDLMISDWSGAALEYAFGLHKPVLFIDVPKKVQNEAYQSLSVLPLEVSIRGDIGLIQSMDLKDLAQNLSHLIEHSNSYQNKLNELCQKYVYNIGNSHQNAVQHIKGLL